MIKLSDNAPAPSRIDLGDGAWIEVRSCTALEFYAARDKAQPLIAALLLGARAQDDLAAILGAEFGEPRGIDDPAWLSAASERLALIEIVTQCANEWGGIGDADGSPVPLDRANIARLLREPGLAQKISAVVNKPIHERGAEGNASAASPSGAAAAAMNSADPAGKTASAAPGAAVIETAVSVPSNLTPH